jgi:predicted nuclease of predicted toxin-antitoxin system
MKVLLDECLPKKLKREVNGDVVKTVPEMGWAGKKNGVLMRLAEQEFDVLLTNDRNLEYQQNLKDFNLAVIVLAAHTNDIEDLKPLMADANEALKTIGAGEVVHIEASSD